MSQLQKVNCQNKVFNIANLKLRLIPCLLIKKTYMVLCVFTAAAETAYLSPDVNSNLQPTTVNTFCSASEIQDGNTRANRVAQPTQGLEKKLPRHTMQK